ncbi:transposase [Loigolactobacillus coryniformis]|uniref:transposase n=1 Tax=Loigolactobacillus coryniformis TaxID=1610 RepID=UPI00345C7DF3
MPRALKFNGLKKQKAYYSGKRKCPTLKNQLIIDFKTHTILTTDHAKGAVHDFKLFKTSIKPKHILSRRQLLADSGYQGINRIHANTCGASL